MERQQTPTVTVEQYRERVPGPEVTGPEFRYWYKVTQTTGTTTPHIWEDLQESHIQALIDQGYKVIVRPPSS